MKILISILFFICSITTRIRSQLIQDQEPRGIHLAYTKKPSSEINIIWWTQGPITSAIVFYSLIDLQDEHVSVDSLLCKHDRSQKGYISRNSTSGKYIHRVTLENLKANSRYCYEIQSGLASSHVYSFRTSDLSINMGHSNYNQDEEQEQDFTNSYFIINSNNLKIEQNQSRNDYFQIEENKETISFLIESMRYQLVNKKVISFINLEASVNLNDFKQQSNSDSFNLRQSNSYEKDFLDYYNDILSQMGIINLIQTKSNQLHKSMFPFEQYSNSVYSIDLNGVHYLTFSSTSSLVSIEEDLIKANTNRHFTPWIIVLLPYDGFFNSKNVEALFYEYNVDLILSLSDSYYYERTYPVLESMNKYELNYDQIEMPIRISLPKDNFKFNNQTRLKSKWVSTRYAGQVNDYTYGMIQVVNNTLLKWVYMHSNESIIDEFELVKDHNDAFERVYNHRIEFLNKNFGFNLQAKSVENSQVSNTKKQSEIKSYSKIIMYVLFTFLILCVFVYFVHYYYKRNLRLKLELKYKLTNYTNLIESEFDHN